MNQQPNISNGTRDISGTDSKQENPMNDIRDDDYLADEESGAESHEDDNASSTDARTNVNASDRGSQRSDKSLSANDDSDIDERLPSGIN